MSARTKDTPDPAGIELTWPGKYAADGRPAIVAPARLRLRKRFGPPAGAAWADRLIEGEAAAVATALRNEFAGAIDLVYIDPPFATGGDFSYFDRATGQSAPAYRDRWGEGLASYLGVMAKCLRAVHPLIAARGSIIVHVDYRAAAHLRLLLDEIFGAENFRNEIVWHYQSGGIARAFYPRKHDTLLWYGRGPSPFFDGRAASQPRNLCPSCGQTLSRWNNLKKHLDEHGRVFRTIKSAGKLYRYYDDEPSRVPDVWLGIAHLQQKDPERSGYPTQKPLRLLDRIVRAHCPEGGLVADFFCGSGTTLLAAEAAGRRWLGVDASPVAIDVSIARLSGSARASREGGRTFERWDARAG